MEEPEIRKRKRGKSRFDDDGSSNKPPESQDSQAPVDPTIIAAKAAEISRKILLSNNLKIDSMNTIQQNSIKAAEIQAQLASQIASVTDLLKNVNQPFSKNSKYRPLRLDSLGREVDEYGNIVKKDTQIKTLNLNNAVIQAQRKKENPYLAHRSQSKAPSYLPGVTPNTVTDGFASVLPSSIVKVDDPAPSTDTIEMVDERLVLSNREKKGKKALHFAEPGKYIQLAEEIRLKEERKIIAGYSSGRKALEVNHDDSTQKELPTIEENSENESEEADDDDDIPPPADESVVPSMEWWDEAFLPKSLRELRRRSRAAAEQDDFQQLGLLNAKSFKYVQHPVAIKPLGGDRSDIPLPMFLTKKERQRLRKSARAEREREKRDKMMMGLLPPAEPKFKLSNFMKVLGDQAVADPSKVEMKVLQQMRQRVMNHEMRNQAAKLTPAERKLAKMKKMQEDTSRQVHIAVFRLVEFSNPKHRFKVDVNAQQHFLTGLVLLNQEEKVRCNLIIAEGGPKGIRKFVKLLTKRISWNEVLQESAANKQNSAPGQEEPESAPFNPPPPAHAKGEDDSDDDDDDDDDDEAHPSPDEPSHVSGGSVDDNRCALVWQGIVAKRTFTGFKFQEFKNSASARKYLESKNAAHFWDIAFKNISI